MHVNNHLKLGQFFLKILDYEFCSILCVINVLTWASFAVRRCFPFSLNNSIVRCNIMFALYNRLQVPIDNYAKDGGPGVV